MTRIYLYPLLIALFCLVPSLEAKVKIMPLGDSITWDWYYGDERTDAYLHSYRNHLWYKLQDTGYDVDFVGSRVNGQAITPSFDGNNEGYTRYTTYQIRDLVYDRLTQESPDIILLHIGTNDSMYHSPEMASYHLSELLDEIDRYQTDHQKHVTVILARIIPLPKSGDWVSAYNSNLDGMASDRINNGDDIVIVNMNGITSLIDGIHPTDAGYIVKWQTYGFRHSKQSYPNMKTILMFLSLFTDFYSNKPSSLPLKRISALQQPLSPPP